ncbi:hypothetical protein AURDEDRAFT_178283 [Auricularia subglabra TFB-10046 SS5]|uniref:Uncharacterized protein n=1 Tax=Auricularia subglabra (strain TFB-10046 / SS5) TaxID=717982 RepID=J0D1Z3_AURST|nr:hypothetical protein AURDEDRAFT_178283 [Auricularia subglabra TFB-10046 SS5]
MHLRAPGSRISISRISSTIPVDTDSSSPGDLKGQSRHALCVPIPARLYLVIKRKDKLLAALGWSDEVFVAIQDAVRDAAASYLNTDLTYDDQRTQCVDMVCSLMRIHWPDLPAYEADWHVKAIIWRYLDNRSKRKRRRRTPAGSAVVDTKDHTPQLAVRPPTSPRWPGPDSPDTPLPFYTPSSPKYSTGTSDPKSPSWITQLYSEPEMSLSAPRSPSYEPDPDCTIGRW